MKSFRTSPRALTGLILAALTAHGTPAVAADPPNFLTPVEMVAAMGRGINLGNTLDAPDEGGWEDPVEPFFFDDLAAAGFTNVRIPVRWDMHMAGTPDATGEYPIDAAWMTRVEEVVDQALDRGLVVILNAHHEHWLMDPESVTDPETKYYDDEDRAARAALAQPYTSLADFAASENLARFKSIWTQIALRFRDKSPYLVFEIVNEPYFELSKEEVDLIQAEVLPIVRVDHPQRTVILTGGGASSWQIPSQIAIPEDDYLMAYFHYYLPFSFTKDNPGGVWGSRAERTLLESHFDEVKAWSEEHNVPILLGEVGADVEADRASRIEYYKRMAMATSHRGFAFSAWEASGKRIHHRAAGQWDAEIRDALLVEDSDHDGIDDQTELASGYDPNDPDMDDDGLTDGAEVDFGFLPQDPSDGAGIDSDGDTVTNGDEVAAGLDPTAAYDGLGAVLSAADYQSDLGRGVVMTWGPWKRIYKRAVAEAIQARGFGHVRIELNVAADLEMFGVLDFVVADLLSLGVVPVLSYDVPAGADDMTVAANRQAFVDWWAAVASRYRRHSHRLSFDLTAKVQKLDFVSAADANALYADVTNVVRGELGTRILIFSPPMNGKPVDLSKLQVPSAAAGFALAKWQFWHNGPKNQAGSGTSWTSGTQAETDKITQIVNQAASWQQDGNAPVYHGAWRSYDGSHTYTLEQEQAFSSFLTGETAGQAMPWAVSKLSDYFDPSTLEWMPGPQSLVDVFVGATTP